MEDAEVISDADADKEAAIENRSLRPGGGRNLHSLIFRFINN